MIIIMMKIADKRIEYNTKWNYDHKDKVFMAVFFILYNALHIRKPTKVSEPDKAIISLVPLGNLVSGQPMI